MKPLNEKAVIDFSIMLQLTPREHDVLELIGSGNNTKDIARKLNLSIKTIESHKETLKRKLAMNREQIAVLAAKYVYHCALFNIERQYVKPLKQPSYSFVTRKI